MHITLQGLVLGSVVGSRFTTSCMMKVSFSSDENTSLNLETIEEKNDGSSLAGIESLGSVQGWGWFSSSDSCTISGLTFVFSSRVAAGSPVLAFKVSSIVGTISSSSGSSWSIPGGRPVENMACTGDVIGNCFYLSTGLPFRVEQDTTGNLC